MGPVSIGVEVQRNTDGDTPSTPKAIRCANYNIFWWFDISEPTSDLLQNDLQRKSSLIIITDVNMTSERAFLQKVTNLLNSTTKNEVLFE